MSYSDRAGLSLRYFAPALVAGALLSACAPVQERVVYRDRPVEVLVPVVQSPAVPLYLRAEVPRPALRWEATGAVCLSDADAARLRDAAFQWLTRIDAWEAWATPQTPVPSR